MSATPRTDAVVGAVVVDEANWMDRWDAIVDLARTLERELEEAKRLRGRVEEMYDKCARERGEFMAIIRDVRAILKTDNAIEGAQQIADYAEEMRAALERLAKYPRLPSDELSPMSMRNIARAALAKNPAAGTTPVTEGAVQEHRDRFGFPSQCPAEDDYLVPAPEVLRAISEHMAWPLPDCEQDCIDLYAAVLEGEGRAREGHRQ